MTTIASYTATLGVNIDQSSLGKIDKYLKAIEDKLKSFSNRIGKSSNISVKLNVDTHNLKRSLDKALSKSSIELDNLSLSSSSLSKIKKQLEDSLNNLNVSTSKVGKTLGMQSLDSKIRTPSRSGGGSGGASFNGRGGFLGSPMAVSGSAGALISYGSRAIPFVAGAYGYNAMADKAIEVNRQAMTMLQATGGDESRSRDLIAGLEKTASSLAMRVSDVFPAFVQLYSGARSIGIEKTIPQGYENFLKYATVSGANTENIKSASRALFQIMSKGQFMAEEVNTLSLAA